MKRSLGAFGEAWAVGRLSQRGYTIVDRNVRYRQGEIDIVAREGGELVFVEVKTRRTLAFGSPQESITHTRYQRLATAIQLYLAEKNLDPPAYRVDVVAVYVDPSGRVANHEILRGVEAPP